MAFELPALPSFQTNIQQPDLTQKALEGAQLRNMLSEMALRKALAPLQVQQAQQQVQSGDIENQMKAMALQGQRAMADWLKNGDASAEVPPEKFSSNDRIATFVGVTPNDPIMSVVRSMAQHNVPAPVLVTQAQGMLERRNEYFKGTKEEQDAQKNERVVWQEVLASLHELPEDQRSAQLAAKLPILQQNSKTSPLLDTYAKGLAGHPELIDQAYNMISGENAALGLRKAKAETVTAEQKVIPTGGGLSPEAKQEQQRQIGVETSPQVIGARVGQAVATEVGKQRALAPELSQVLSTTRAGRRYINREDIPQGSTGVTEQQAAAAGIPVVDKDVASTLSDIDTAKANQDYMLNTIGKKLASGAPGRLWTAPANTIEKLAQTDPELAAMGTFRNAAIQSMRAVAGSKGLRINQYEVQMAIDNDIPKMTDTLPVAQQKLKNLQTFLENSESAHLTKNRQTAAQPQGWGAQFGGTLHQ